jgi:ribosomal protein L11 methyltransferase
VPWLQVHIETTKGEAESIETILEGMGALSVSLADAADEPILELGPGETRLWQQIRLSALFDAGQDEARLDETLRQCLPQLAPGQMQWEHLADQPWERAWLTHFQPMRFGKRLWIRPGDMPVDAADALVIDLDPGLAFGTGTHPTTALCLEWLEQADLHGKAVIDFGCGSGVLAIAALKLGAACVHGLDHDPQAIQASRDNAERNQVVDRLRLYPPGEHLAQGVDLVVANILSGTLISLADSLAALTLPAGTLLLSGVLESQAEAVLQAYRNTFDIAVVGVREGWVLLEGVRHTHSAAC